MRSIFFAGLTILVGMIVTRPGVDGSDARPNNEAGEPRTDDPARDAVEVTRVMDGRKPRVLPWDHGMALSVAFSPDGKTFAVGSNQNLIALYDLEPLKERVTLDGHPLPRINALAFSPDGTTLASANGDYHAQVQPCEVWLWNVRDKAVRLKLQGHTGHVWSVAFTADGKTLATASADRTVKLWDVATGEMKKSIEAHAAPVRRVAFTPDGKRLASAGFDGQIKYWDLPTLEINQIIPAHENGANALRFSPDGKLLATSERLPGQGLEAKLKIWEVATTKQLHTLEGALGRVLAITFRPDGRLMATGGGIYREVGDLKLWDPVSGKRLWDGSCRMSIDDLAFSPDGNTLVTVGGVEGGGGEVQVWDVSGLLK